VYAIYKNEKLTIINSQLQEYQRTFTFKINIEKFKSVFSLVTLFQIPQYEHLQILICNGNSLTTLAGVEHIKHLWKLDVGNNQVNKKHL